MEARLDFFGSPVGGKVLRHINSANKVVPDSALPTVIQELVKLRASQINGCGFCTDLHSKDTAHAGETQQRLNLVAAWDGGSPSSTGTRRTPTVTPSTSGRTGSVPGSVSSR